MQQVWQHFIVKQDLQKATRTAQLFLHESFLFLVKLILYFLGISNFVVAATAKCHEAAIFVACFGQLSVQKTQRQSVCYHIKWEKNSKSLQLSSLHLAFLLYKGL